MAKNRRKRAWALISTSAVLFASIGTVFPAAAADVPGGIEYLVVEVSLNGQRQEQDSVLLRSPDGTFFASQSALESWRLKRPNARTVEVDGLIYHALDAEGLTIRMDQQTQRIDISVRPDLLEASVLDLTPAIRSRKSDTHRGAYLNYEVMAEYSEGTLSLNGAMEAVVFTPTGVGSTSFIGHWGDRHSKLTRLDSTWTIDFPGSMRSLRIGDAVMRGGVGGVPLRFGGIQWARNYAVAPDFITLPLPSISGSAAVPSVVDIFVNNSLQAQQDVPAGPFTINDLPILTGTGEIQLVVRDALGREMVTTQSYYAAPQLLRRGLHDYSYELGFLRKNYAIKNNDYGELAAAATHRYGIADNLTVEAHAEASAEIQVAGVATSLLVPDIGLIDLAAATSHSDGSFGSLLGAGIERRSMGLSFGARAEYTTPDYRHLGLPDYRESPRLTARAFASLPLSFGSIGASYVIRDERGEKPDAEVLGANASVQLGALGSLHISAQHIFGERSETLVGLFLATPLGPSRSASAGIEVGSNGTQLTAGLQKSPPLGEGWGYQASASLGYFDRVSGRLIYRTGFGQYDADVTWTGRGSGLRVAASGAIGHMDGGGTFASRKLTESFATVQVGDFEGVKVYADNQVVARTDASGFAIIPNLRAYEDNVIRIDIADLPWDAIVTHGTRTVRPYARSGVAVEFGVREANGALVTVLLDDGSSLPSGATLRIHGNDDESFTSAPGGEAYLTGLSRRNRVSASWGGQSCTFDLPYLKSDDPQPRLGPFQCRRQ